MRFSAEIELGGKTATGVQVHGDVVLALGSSNKPADKVTINGYTYRCTVASMGGVFMLPVSAEVREGAGIAAGDVVEVALELDTGPREVQAPPDTAGALALDEKARSFFDGLSYGNKRRIVLAIDGAKTEETRRRRIDKSVENPREGRI